MVDKLDLWEVFSRHVPVLGKDCVEKLRDATVLVVGVGGLGSVVALYLALTGVGRLVLVDNGVVEASNLNRQILYMPEDIGKLKVEVAKKRLEQYAPWCRVEAHPVTLTEEVAEKLVAEADVVVDALDNWASRRVLNRVCVRMRKPLVHGGVSGAYGQVTVIVPCKTPCLDCIAPRGEEKPGVPVLGMAVGVVALLQATEVVKLLCGWGEGLQGKMLLIDLESCEFDVIEVRRSPTCPTCSKLCR